MYVDSKTLQTHHTHYIIFDPKTITINVKFDGLLTCVWKHFKFNGAPLPTFVKYFIQEQKLCLAEGIYQ